MEDNQWPLFYNHDNRFVDDMFAVFVNEEKSVEFFNPVNKLNPALHFTVEGEEDGMLLFMDVWVKRTSGGLEQLVYPKLTFTGVFTPWDSFLPISQTIA